MDTFAPSYRSLAVHGPGDIAARAESLKKEKYNDMLHTHEFVPMENIFVTQVKKKMERQTSSIALNLDPVASDWKSSASTKPVLSHYRPEASSPPSASAVPAK